MVRSSSADPARNHDEAWLVAAALTLFLLAWGIAYASLTWARQDPPTNPVTLALELGAGDLTWPSQATWFAVGLVLVAVTLIGTCFWLARLIGGHTLEVDRAGRHMANRRDVDALTRKPVTKTARAFGATVGADGTGIGLPLGHHLPSKARLWSTWEDMLVLLAGPRTMKSSSYTIPLTLAAPGACLVTENKRGVLDHTRGPRSERGHVWVFDPQGVANEPVSWWWNPLTYVTDESRAEKMARQVAESTRTPGHKTPYFDDAAVTLIAHLLLAAACDHQPITEVYSWLVMPTDERPVEVLRAHGYTKQAEDLYAKAHLSDRQRDGVYGTAQQVMAFGTNSQMMAWVTAPAHAGAAQFDPHAFVRSTDTLYALSNDGAGSAGPLVGALTLAVFDAAETHATGCRGGRLPTPLVGLLDEAANVCRLRDLDSKYSHYGSRGIVLLTVLQSPDQAEEIWGRPGWHKLWSSANVKIYGGGVANTDFLRQLSDLIGTYEHVTGTTSSGRGGRTRSSSVTERQILTIAELAALPRGRAIVLASGVRPALVRVTPWFRRGRAYRTPIEASLTAHDPTRRPSTERRVETSPTTPSPALEQPSSSPWDVGPIRR